MCAIGNSEAGLAPRTRVAELEAKLGLPPKTPNNSSTPPSQGRNASGEEKNKSEGERRKAHAGAHRPLHPDPTSRRDVTAKACQHCGADVSRRPQTACEAYDHVESPASNPMSRVMLFGGTCPCCAKKFKAPAPQDMTSLAEWHPRGTQPAGCCVVERRQGDHRHCEWRFTGASPRSRSFSVICRRRFWSRNRRHDPGPNSTCVKQLIWF